MSERPSDRLPFALLGLLALISLATLWHPPAGRQSWLLETGPGLCGVAVMIASYKRFRLSNLIYVCAFVHMLILIYGGYYTYALTPLGNWAKEAFHLSRNHYDRVGHFALGFFPALYARELLLRTSPLRRGKWLFFIVSAICLAIGAFWELVEWWTTLLVAPDVGQAFLGTQGDVWDTQWDMLWVLIGALVSLATMSGVHDRALGRVSDA